MLDAHGQQAIGVDHAAVAVFIQRTHAHLDGALHAIVHAGYGKAAFVAGLAFFAEPLDFGVDQHHALVARFRHIHHHHALVYIDLSGSQAYAIGFVHGVEHIVHECADGVVHGLYRAGDGVQLGIGIHQNGKQGHKGTPEYGKSMVRTWVYGETGRTKGRMINSASTMCMTGCLCAGIWVQIVAVFTRTWHRKYKIT